MNCSTAFRAQNNATFGLISDSPLNLKHRSPIDSAYIQMNGTQFELWLFVTNGLHESQLGYAHLFKFRILS